MLFSKKTVETLEICVSFVTIQDLVACSFEQVEAAEGNIDVVIDDAMAREFAEIAIVKACLGAYDSIEAYNPDGDSINPDGEILRRIAKVVKSLKSEFVDWIEHAEQAAQENHDDIYGW